MAVGIHEPSMMSTVLVGGRVFGTDLGRRWSKMGTGSKMYLTPFT